jgi:hypothetical protein
MWRSIPKRLRSDVVDLLGELAVLDLEYEGLKEHMRMQELKQHQRDLEREKHAHRLFMESEAGQQAAARMAAAMDEQNAMIAQIQAYLAQVRVDGGDVCKEAAKSSWRLHELAYVLPRALVARVRKLRDSGMWSARVRATLGCTQSELDRWDTPGRLSHAYQRLISYDGQKVIGRIWFEQDVLLALESVESWRAEDARYTDGALFLPSSRMPFGEAARPVLGHG